MEKLQRNLLGRQIGLKLGVDGRFALHLLGTTRARPASVVEAIVATSTAGAPAALAVVATATATCAAPTIT